MAVETFLGQDLDLGFVADEAGRVIAGPFSRVDLQAVLRRDVAPRATDLLVVEGRANLVQALIMRLMTEQGELAALGHATYGSRHHQLVGSLNNENNRSLLKLYILECLQQEPRLAAVLRVDVLPLEGRQNRDRVHIEIEVQAHGEPDPLSLVVPFSFGGPLP